MVFLRLIYNVFIVKRTIKSVRFRQSVKSVRNQNPGTWGTCPLLSLTGQPTFLTLDAKTAVISLTDVRCLYLCICLSQRSS